MPRTPRVRWSYIAGVDSGEAVPSMFASPLATAVLLALAACSDSEVLGSVDAPIRARVVWHDETYLTVAGTAHIGVPNGLDDEHWVELQVDGCEPLRLREPLDADSEVELTGDPAGGRIAYHADGQPWRVAYIRGDQLVVGAETFAIPPRPRWRIWGSDTLDWSVVPSFRQARRGALEARSPARIGYLNYTPRVWESVWLVDGTDAYVQFLIEALDVPDDSLGADWEMAVRNLQPEARARVLTALVPHLLEQGPVGARARRMLGATPAAP